MRCKLKPTALAWRLSEADHHSGQSGQQRMMEGEPGERHQEILAVKDDGGSAVWRIILHFQATDGLSQEQVDYYQDIFAVFDRQVSCLQSSAC